MAVINQQQVSTPDQTRFPPIARLRLRYDRAGDILTVSLVPPRPAISVDVGGEGWLRILPAMGDVVGIEIEDFQAGFLRKHPDLARQWRQAQAHPRRLGIPRGARHRFLTQLVRYFHDAFAGHRASR